MVVENLGKGGGQTKSVGDVLQGGGAGSTSFWVGEVLITPHMGKDLGGFQHKVDRQITGKQL